MTAFPLISATVEWSDDGTVWAPIPGAENAVIPEVDQDYKEATRLDSPNGFKEYSKGLKDAGTISLMCDYSKELYAAAVAKNNSATPTYFRITLEPDASQSAGDVFSWQAWVTPSVPGKKPGEDLMIELKQRVTGDVSWDQGAA